MSNDLTKRSMACSGSIAEQAIKHADVVALRTHFLLCIATGLSGPSAKPPRRSSCPARPAVSPPGLLAASSAAETAAAL